MEQVHESVLLNECLESLAIKPGDTVVDATIGGAGHFRAMLERLGEEGTLVGIDADEDAIERAAAVVRPVNGPKVHLAHDNFRNLDAILEHEDIESIDKALFDLGWSSFHLSAGRGFSFRADEPLYMTYGSPEEGNTAADLVNSASEEELADIIFNYGEERFSRGIARAIVAARRIAPILTTTQLAEAVENGVPGWYQHRRLHPATKTFQALRIAVNDELGALRAGLSSALARLTPGGRIAVITFHSIEDRIVKGMFRDEAYQGTGKLVNKKPIAPSDDETARNPRSRSAKLRVFERCTGAGTCPAAYNHSALSLA
ncbi:MAG TPA: 16S rRNA (cytosine(1402)-N(4))-methyltransferase RsmH [Candidatus Paceibacterota bacterium]|jgi:16S rRNA (cytosine1402-N4)-methyltransferase|nr:16S rRNA (cytosine(1402)-N(4))-methyltransferase RsmH [Candidatus Paceibacterota bacterium]